MSLVPVLLITLLTALVLSGSSYVQGQPEHLPSGERSAAASQPKGGEVTFVNQHYHFSVTYPSHWERIQLHWDDPDGDRHDTTAPENPAYWNAVMFNQRRTPAVPGITIYVHQKPSATLDESSQRLRQWMERYDGKLLSAKETVMSGLKAYEFVLLFPATRNKWRQIHLYHEGWRYVISHSTVIEDFDKFRGDVDRLIRSFRLVK